MRKTKIVCTIGPASASKDILKQLILNGMDIARINLSHASIKERIDEIILIRKLSNELNKDISIMLDLAGPKIRIGEVENNEVELVPGENIVLTNHLTISNSKRIYINYPFLSKDVKVNESILLDDGKIKLIVLKLKSDEVLCKVINGGILKSKKGVSFPTSNLNIPTMTSKDLLDIKFAVSQKVDFLAMSFVRNGNDIIEIKEILKKLKSKIPVIAKIEKHEAINNIDEILKETDAVMVARGDLGVEVPLENVPIYQKMIIEKSNQIGKPVITATQMLESMIENPTPTRAEVADIANAILDGTDAIMLSAETSVGKYPINAVQIMSKIAEKSEQIINYSNVRIENNQSISDAVAHGACQMASDLSAAAIITFTNSGYTAKMISKYRPKTDIYAFTLSSDVSRSLNIYWGIKSFVMDMVNSTDEMFKLAIKTALENKIVKKGDTILFTAGIPVKEKANTNLIRVIKI